ncbi:MAG: 3-oxoacyl-[acyl-carrier-protein] reductase FabG, partial [Microgenomates group bacterium GW2011_GWC1_43_11]
MKLHNKVAIITGSSRGIGKATAMLFAKEGARVVINYKTHKKEGQAVASSIGKDRSLLIQADITKEENVKMMVSETIKKFGKIDILINNAGEILRPGDWKSDIDTWHKTLDINLTSAWL